MRRGRLPAEAQGRREEGADWEREGNAVDVRCHWA